MSPHSSVVFRQAFPPDSPSRVSTFSRCMSTLSITLFHLFVSQHSPDVCQHSLLPCSTYSCLHILQMYVNTLSYPVPLIRVSTLSRCMSTFSLTLFHLFVSPHSPDVCQHSLLPFPTYSCLHTLQMYVNTLSYPVPPIRVSTLSICMSTLSLTLFHLSGLHTLQKYVNTLSYPVSPSHVSTLSIVCQHPLLPCFT